MVDQWVASCLVPLAVWVLISGLDDFVLALAWCYRWLWSHASRSNINPWPAESELDRAEKKRIAIFVPLWQEHQVIQRMLEHNVTVSRYDRHDFFIGAYPNDELTIAALREPLEHFPNVHLALCPHDGPTSKADCLNWIYQHMLLFEEERQTRFDIVLTHDAEDLIHPESLRWVNYFAQSYDMVQVPVLPLPTPFWNLTHGVYCDEFAEFQTKDFPTRQFLNGFVPSSGVGTGYSRTALEKLASGHSNFVFAPECLTEDYEIGFRMYILRCPQIFLPIRSCNGSLIATREFFPRKLFPAVRQRTRWIMGIAMQSWERHGWGVINRQTYWFWRDRKGLVGNLVSPVANILFLYGCATWLWSLQTGSRWPLAEAVGGALSSKICLGTLSIQLFHLVIRAACVCRIYGWPFALGVPVRAAFGNWINLFATVWAFQRYFSAKLRHRPLVWLKTEHAYPSRAALMAFKRQLGEILVRSGHLTAPDLEQAILTQPKGLRIGEYLVRLGRISQEHVYEALSRQQSVPLGRPDPQSISRSVTRSLPVEFSRRWKLLPYKVAAGRLFVVGSELPSDEMTRQLRQHSSLEMRFQLVTPGEFEELAKEFLPPRVKPG